MDKAEIERIYTGIGAGDKGVIAQAITWIEDRHDGADALLELLYRQTGRAHVVGITGPPGAGKSTLVNEIARIWAAQGLRVGIIAIDPSSPFSRGAVLGDRVRMRGVSGQQQVFIRSLANRGFLGGLSRSTADVVKIFDGAGMDVVIIETVGVGQSEVSVCELAHTVVVVAVPNAGDAVQTLKAGLLEIADVFVVNKRDMPGAVNTVRQLRQMLAIRRSSDMTDRPSPWDIPLVSTNALASEGVMDVVRSVDEHRHYLRSSGLWETREARRATNEVELLLREDVVPRVLERARQSGLWDTLLPRVIARELSPLGMAHQLAEIPTLTSLNAKQKE
ncbi:MAG: methylmalonyl Co-A mutase-associated GTPase MeaB [Sulfobacillus benefaciens]|uniref:Methylmalonyl Co-A mutase-associated GTPase MeaB n=1 Tax=Sulfobacillus benefaciens TaxID=453960 RepID=A0A2T2XBY2_9FIRM|nr:MAG: methylmalonyl Co-A mutase-associated GTPase MeaB [Sulfobacillus benefaciens]